MYIKREGWRERESFSYNHFVSFFNMSTMDMDMYLRRHFLVFSFSTHIYRYICSVSRFFLLVCVCVSHFPRRDIKTSIPIISWLLCGRVCGERKITRYKNAPTSASVLRLHAHAGIDIGMRRKKRQQKSERKEKTETEGEGQSII